MDKVLSEAIEKDLYNELRWLLSAATEWDALDRLIGEPPKVPKIKEPCPHLKVYAMDSAFLHARSLYEFFTSTEKAILKNKKQGQRRLTWYDYSTNSNVRRTSTKYDHFMQPLHGRVMHLDQNRSGYDEIKKEVVNIAEDILVLWNSFSKHPDLKSYSSLLDKFRGKAIEESLNVAERYKKHGFESPFAKFASPTPEK
jgi:hypothetical protein